VWRLVEALATAVALLMGTMIGPWLLVLAFVLTGSERNGKDVVLATELSASLAVVACWVRDTSGGLGIVALATAVLLGAAGAGLLLVL
jgi:hypothetical protein